MKINSSRIVEAVVLVVSIGILILIWGLPNYYPSILVYFYSQRDELFFLSTFGKVIATFIVFVSIALTFGPELCLWIVQRRFKKG